MLARVYHAQEPAFAYSCLASRACVKLGESRCEQDGDGLLWRFASQRSCDCIAPELKTHQSDCWGRGGVGDHREGYIKGAQGEVEAEGLAGDEGAEGVGGAVIFSSFG